MAMFRRANRNARQNQARRAAPRQQLASVMGSPKPRELRASDFTGEDQVQGRLSTVARYTVPRNVLLAIQTGKPFRMLIRAQHTETIPDSDGNTTYTLDLSTSGISLVQSAKATELPSTKGDVVVYLNGTKANVTAIDYEANTVTVEKDENTEYAAVAYGFVGNGSVRMVAVQPSGIDGREIELYQDTLRALNETDQASARTAPRIVRPGLDQLPLGPKWQLHIKIDSTAPIVWNSDAKHTLRFPVGYVQIGARQERQLGSLIREALR